MEDALRELYEAQGLTIAEVASRLGVSQRRARVLLLEHGITLRRRGPRRDIPAVSISDELRASLQAQIRLDGVAATARRNGLSHEVLHALTGERPLPKGQKPKSDDEAIREEYQLRLGRGEAADVVVTELAARYDCHSSTIRLSLRRTCVRPEVNQLRVNGAVGED